MAPRELTKGERLLIERRRRDCNQRTAALLRGVSQSRYQAWELDKEDGAPDVPIGKLKPHERCFLARRRAGGTREWLAGELRCSKRWVTLMERGEVACDRLTAFWES